MDRAALQHMLNAELAAWDKLTEPEKDRRQVKLEDLHWLLNKKLPDWLRYRRG